MCIRDSLKWVEWNQPNLEHFINERLVKLNTNHTVSGNPIRFKQGEIEIQPDREWVEKLSLTKKYFVTALTYPFLRAYARAEIKEVKNG